MGGEGVEPCSELRESLVFASAPKRHSAGRWYITWATSACQTPTVNRWDTTGEGGGPWAAFMCREANGLTLSVGPLEARANLCGRTTVV